MQLYIQHGTRNYYSVIVVVLVPNTGLVIFKCFDVVMVFLFPMIQLNIGDQGCHPPDPQAQTVDIGLPQIVVEN